MRVGQRPGRDANNAGGGLVHGEDLERSPCWREVTGQFEQRADEGETGERARDIQGSPDRRSPVCGAQGQELPAFEEPGVLPDTRVEEAAVGEPPRGCAG